MDLLAPRHLLVILLIVMLVFGTKKLGSIGADLGSAIRGFKQAMKDGNSEGHADHDAAVPPTLPSTTQDSPGDPKTGSRSTA